MNSFLKQQALQKLVSLCPLCYAAQPALQAQIIQESNDAELVHVNCNTCQGSVIALIFSTGSLISSIGLVTDLSPQEVSNWQYQAPLNEDDVITLHRVLREPKLVTNVLHELK